MSSAVLTDPLPSGTQFLSVPGASFANDIVTWPIGALPAGASGTVTLAVTTTSIG